MIVVDTSVWINYFKGKDKLLVESLGFLLDEERVLLTIATQLELLSGVRRQEFQKLKRVLSALPKLYPSTSTWGIMENWIEKGTSAGQRFGIMDLMIGVLAHEQKALVWSLDRDFVRMQKLGMISLFSF